VKAKAAELVAMKQRYVIPCSYHFYKDPPVITRGEMQYLTDSEGRRYTDFYSGVTVMNCGHCNPEIIEPVVEQIRTLQHTTSIYLTEPILRLAEALVDFLDCRLRKVFFVNSGSEANEGALLLSRLHTGRNSFIALDGGLHGRTALTMDLTGIAMWRTAPTETGKIHFGPRPRCSQCPLGLARDGCDTACVDEIERLIMADGDVAAVIAEPVQGNGGIVVPPPEYFMKLKAMLERHGVLLILDEIQTGFGRTGKRFAFKHFGIEPDILTVAKALGNGFPISAFSATDEIASAYTKPGASTTGGNAVSATAAIHVIDYHRRHRLEERSAELGAILKARLIGMKDRFPGIREVRGLGLMLGMELGTNDNPMATETDRILEKMKDAGFLIGKTGVNRNVLTFMPPLIIEEDDVNGMLQALSQTLEEEIP
jgi:4-aminobutyrate aminotransferase/4-aminobutyrate aminotransferase/(S)-3-amino-2-methylpropionate transaminase